MTSIAIFAFAGNDFVHLDNQVSVRALLDGGDGSDTLRAGGATALLLGGAGDDLLLGGSARNILIGGAGKDALHGRGEEDILIGGTTAYDDDRLALSALLAIWAGPGSFHARQGAIQSSLFPLTEETVFDDDDIDVLLGGLALDWIFES